ncbi:hypothetical protein DFH08DRAFT_957177 [Mycena albidolilacea]|uniref:Uncharacterized protein n=1 Tax=Mycena albidolilacea TaxID=1033008 RepID=A0AAD7EWZ0_9AGAR|nr:hypothetical protein DFH08DRAFT_957177 [Mycena albidolilacea]
MEAQQKQAEADKYVAFMCQEIHSKTTTIAELQHSESELSAQVFQDQQKINELRNECMTAFPKLAEVHNSLLEHKAHVHKLSVDLHQKQNEVIQLRTVAVAAVEQAKKSAKKAPGPARRGTCTSLTPVRNTGTSTIQMPLDPVGATKAPSKPNPKTHQGTLAEAILCNAVYMQFAVKQADNFQIYNPATGADIELCEDGPDLAEDHFQWDFLPGYTMSRWNWVIDKVINTTMEADVAGSGRIACHDVERSDLEYLMKEKMVRYHKSWKEFQPRFDAAQGCMETIAESRVRATQANEQHLLNCRSTTAKHCKLITRVSTIINSIKIKIANGTTDNLVTWERLKELVELLGELGMLSEDKSEVEVDNAKHIIFKIKLCIWCKSLVVNYLCFVNKKTALFKEHQRGPKPALRIRTDEHGSSKAPHSLPQSLYGCKWFKAQTPTFIRELKISKQTFGLFKVATDRMAI